jgi:hypothetical protein
MSCSAILSTAILILAFCSVVVGQEPPKASLIDEFGALPCEFVLAKTDALASEIRKEPAATAAVIIFRPSTHPARAENRRRLISSTLQLRGIEGERFHFYSGGPSPDDEIRTQIWMQPAYAPSPAGNAETWNEPSPNPSRAFLYGYSDEVDICPTFVPAAFAKLILDNPGSRGKVLITIGNDSIVEKYSYAAEWIRTLVEVNGIPRKRLRLQFAKGTETGAEFWFMPAGKQPRAMR